MTRDIYDIIGETVGLVQDSDEHPQRRRRYHSCRNDRTEHDLSKYSNDDIHELRVLINVSRDIAHRRSSDSIRLYDDVLRKINAYIKDNNLTWKNHLKGCQELGYACAVDVANEMCGFEAFIVSSFLDYSQRRRFTVNYRLFPYERVDKGRYQLGRFVNDWGYSSVSFQYSKKSLTKFIINLFAVVLSNFGVRYSSSVIMHENQARVNLIDAEKKLVKARLDYEIAKSDRVHDETFLQLASFLEHDRQGIMEILAPKAYKKAEIRMRAIEVYYNDYNQFAEK